MASSANTPSTWPRSSSSFPASVVFNNAKISDHFAIIPTGRFVKLDEAAAKIFDLVTKRFLAVFYPHAEFLNTRRITRITQP